MGTVATRALDRNILGIVLIVCLATLFFPRGERHAKWIFEGAVIPLCLLTAFTPNRPSFANSIILMSCVAYFVAMIGASLHGSDSNPDDILHDVSAAGMIFVFLLAVGWIISNKSLFATQMIFSLSIVAAVSAAVNILFYFLYMAPLGNQPITNYRLLTSFGMRDYANSTNISATYAVFFIGSFATLVRSRLTTLERLALAVSSAVLMAGVLLTQSRGALAGTLVGLAVIILTTSRRFRITAVLSLLAIGLAASAVPVIREALTLRGSSYRPELWSKFLHLIALRPWIGYGPLSPAGITLDDGVFLDQAHNLVLSAWFRAGIVGAAAMVYIILGGLFWTVRYWRLCGDIVPFCVLATIVTAGMVDYQLMITDPTWPWVTFWVPFSLAIGAEMAWRLAHKAARQSGQHLASSDMAPGESNVPGERKDTA